MKKVLGIITPLWILFTAGVAHSESTSLTGQVAEAIVAFDYDRIPGHVKELTERLIADSVAVAVGSHHMPINEAMAEMFEVDGGDHLILHSGQKGKLLEAIYLNSLAANMLDFDDSHIEVGHPGAPIVHSVLVLARKYSKGNEEVLEAIVAGYEFNIRWARAVFGYEGRFDGPWGSQTLQVFGPMVSAGKLLDLDAEQLARAMFFAAANTPLPVYQKIGLVPGQVKSGLKNNYGTVALAGVMAVMTARAGVPAEPTVLDGDQGLWRMMASKEFNPEIMLGGLGDTWEILNTQIKPYAACRWMHSSFDALRAIDEGIDIDDVERVDVEIFDFGVETLAGTNPKTLLELQFSLPHVFALHLAGQSLIDLRMSHAEYAQSLGFASRINLVRSAEFERLFQEEFRMPAKVRLTLSNGEVREKEILFPTGERNNPYPIDEHRTKVQTLIDSSPHAEVREYANRFVF